MNKPTQDDLNTCIEVLEYISASTTKHEPHAVHSIATIEAVLSEMPHDASEIEEI